MSKGFDISYWQGIHSVGDFEKAKAAGLSFVILRCGFNHTLNRDSTFEDNYRNAKAAGLLIGVYYYSTAKTKGQVKAEAKYTLKLISGKKLDYPVFIDFEDKRQRGLGAKWNRSLCEKFCSIIKAAGYKAGVYASYDFLTNKIASISKEYYIWLAQYPKATYKGRFEMHQYSSTTKVPGIGSEIDVSVSAIDIAEDPKPAKTKHHYPGELPKLPKKGYIGYGYQGEQGKRLQMLLNWAVPGLGLKIDGIIGNASAAGIGAFESKYGLGVDKLFGKKCLAKAKTIKR